MRFALAYERAYETRLGIRTGDMIRLRELGNEHEDGRQHFPVAQESEGSPIDHGSRPWKVVVLAAMKVHQST
jgi:hypothetical protein